MLKRSAQPSTADDWAARYGEMANKSKLAQIMGVSRRSIYRMIDDGSLRTSANGSLIFVRSAAAYIETGIPQGIVKHPIAPLKIISTNRFRVSMDGK